MKKIFVLALCFFTATKVFAVWEGNAGVGRAMDFTSGTMEVRSDLFPKNTFIRIENLENGKKTTAIVSGTSGIQGLLVHLSPEVALTLEISPERIVRVRIETTTKLSDDFLNEDSLYTSDSDYNPAYALAQLENMQSTSQYSDSDTVLFDVASLKEYPKPRSPVESAESETSTALTSEPDYLPAEPPSQSGSQVESSALNQNPQSTSQNTPSEPNSTWYTGPGASTKPSSEYKPVAEVPSVASGKAEGSENNFKPVGEVASIVEKSGEKAKDGYKPVSEVATIAEKVNDSVKPQAKPVSEVSTVTAPTEEKAKNSIKPVNEAPGVATPVQEKVQATKPVSNVAATAEPYNNEPIEPLKPVKEAETQKEPTTPKPSGLSFVSEPEKTVVEVEKVETEKIQSETSKPKTQKPSYEPTYTVEPFTVSSDAQMYAGSLEKGKNYLQIANYSNENNVKNVLSRYKQYPIVVVKTGTGLATRYRVFVGPLKQDEMGATMEQFQVFGFKDAFFKVIK